MGAGENSIFQKSVQDYCILCFFNKKIIHQLKYTIWISADDQCRRTVQKLKYRIWISAEDQFKNAIWISRRASLWPSVLAAGVCQRV